MDSWKGQEEFSLSLLQQDLQQIRKRHRCSVLWSSVDIRLLSALGWSQLEIEVVWACLDALQNVRGDSFTGVGDCWMTKAAACTACTAYSAQSAE